MGDNQSKAVESQSPATLPDSKGVSSAGVNNQKGELFN